ncbi:MAG TPA: F0F1 ATP synthase subunit A [Ktedonobacteraceae bacterium]|nr:F0F1 ATP synthase subunit A [Ktedonobacteraceae bacterium]
MFWKLIELKVQPDLLFTIPGINFPVTNTLLCTWLVILVLLVLVFFIRRRQDLVPQGFQNFAEWATESLQNLVEGVSGKVKGRRFFPLVATLFVFILLGNLMDVFPGIDTIGTVHGATNPVSLGFIHFLFGDDSNRLIPWFRPPTTDLNLTFAMALIVVVVCQIFGFMTLGARPHLGKYFKFKGLFTHGVSGPIEFFVGLIEVVTELSRLLSFAFRLFGNIFAGSAVLAVFGLLTVGLGNLIFIPLELFVAFVQALVFALLTLVFLEMASTGHDHEESEEKAFAEYEQNEARKLAVTH